MERRRIAKELHNGISGNMAAIKMLVDGILNLPSKDPLIIEDKLRYLQNVVNLTLTEVRKISDELRADPINLEFADILQLKFKELEKKTAISIRFHSDKTIRNLSPKTQSSLLRSVTELLSYFQQRCDITNLDVKLSFDTQTLTLQIIDNVLNSDQPNKIQVSQFPEIQARMSNLNGLFTIIDNSAEQGSIFTLQLKLDSP